MAKVIFAIFLLGFVAVGTAMHNKCQRKADGTRLAHPYDCTQFLVCEQHQVAHVSNCPSGLHFNRHLGECDVKAAAGCEWFLPKAAEDCVCNPLCCDCCSGITVPTPTPTTTLPTPITPTPTTPSVTTPTPTPSPTTPSVTTPTPTPSPTTPSVTTPTPTPSPTTPSVTTPTPTPTTSVPTTPGTDGCSNDLTVCKGQPNNITLVYDGYCNKWITCQAGCSIILTCPNNLQWVQNGTNGYCDYPQNISPKCPWQSSPPETGPSGISCTNQGQCAGADEGYMYVDPNNSNLYYVCQCECPLPMKCPGVLVYNVTANVCGWPAGYGTAPELVVACDNNSTLCKGADEGDLFAVDGSCNTFYKCNFGCAVVQQCPSGLHFDSKSEVCDYPFVVKCPWDYTPPSGPDAGPSGIACPSGGRCVGQAEGKTFTSKTDCGKYVVCQCECEVEMACPADLSWDNDLENCNYADLVNCALA